MHRAPLVSSHLVKRFDAVPGSFRVAGVRVLAQHIIVINPGSVEAAMPLVKSGDIEAAPRLLGLERFDQSLRCRHPRVLGMEGNEISEGSNRLAGDTLV